MTAPSTGPGRREARQRALELLYEAETRGIGADEMLAALPLEPDRFACDALRGVELDRPGIDATIERHSDGWSIARMPLVDRSILRLATWELLHRPDVPTAVVINEAVELAKDYSTERSPGFVNGVLDAVAAASR